LIELISDARCVACNLCVSVCPTNVFDKVLDDVPVIARQSDCQTCFMCELYCPADAMFVAPHPDRLCGSSEAELEQAELLGGYREQVGWGPGRTPISSHEFLAQLARRFVP